LNAFNVDAAVKIIQGGMEIVENMAQDEVQLVESLVRMHAGLVQPFEQDLAILCADAE